MRKRSSASPHASFASWYCRIIGVMLQIVPPRACLGKSRAAKEKKANSSSERLFRLSKPYHVRFGCRYALLLHLAGDGTRSPYPDFNEKERRERQNIRSFFDRFAAIKKQRSKRSEQNAGNLSNGIHRAHYICE